MIGARESQTSAMQRVCGKPLVLGQSKCEGWSQAQRIIRRGYPSSNESDHSRSCGSLCASPSDRHDDSNFANEVPSRPGQAVVCSEDPAPLWSSPFQLFARGGVVDTAVDLKQRSWLLTDPYYLHRHLYPKLQPLAPKLRSCQITSPKIAGPS